MTEIRTIGDDITACNPMRISADNRQAAAGYRQRCTGAICHETIQSRRSGTIYRQEFSARERRAAAGHADGVYQNAVRVGDVISI